MNLSQEDVETTDFDGDKMLDRYMDIGAGAFSGDDGDTETDLGLPGDTELSSARQRDRDFYTKSTQLGLPDKAVFSDANQITYVDRGFTRGKLRDVEFDMPKFVLAGYTCDIAGTNTDWSEAITGSAGGVNDLYRDLLAEFDDTAVLAGLTGSPVDIGQYLSEGFRQANVVDVDQAMHVRLKGTVEVDLYAPDPGLRSVLTIPR